MHEQAESKVPVHPHPLANELTDEPLTPTPAVDPDDSPDLLTPTERRVTRRVLWIVGGFALIAILLSAWVFAGRQFFMLGSMLILAYMTLLAAPMILAEATKVAQDEAVKEGKTASPKPSKRRLIRLPRRSTRQPRHDSTAGPR